MLLLLLQVGVTLPRLMRAYWVILLSPSLALLCSPYSGSILLTITGTSDAHCSGLLPSMALLKLVTWCQDHAYLITQQVFCPGKLQFLLNQHMIVYYCVVLVQLLKGSNWRIASGQCRLGTTTTCPHQPQLSPPDTYLSILLLIAAKLPGLGLKTRMISVQHWLSGSMTFHNPPPALLYPT